MYYLSLLRNSIWNQGRVDTPTPHPGHQNFRSKYICLEVSSRTPFLGIGWPLGHVIRRKVKSKQLRVLKHCVLETSWGVNCFQHRLLFFSPMVQKYLQWEQEAGSLSRRASYLGTLARQLLLQLISEGYCKSFFDDVAFV